jgi:hypothetical protein
VVYRILKSKTEDKKWPKKYQGKSHSTDIKQNVLQT